MDELISLAIYVGKLEARIEALEKKNGGAAPVSLSFSKDVSEAEPEEEICHRVAVEEPDEGRLMMEGFDNIMAYQWPPKKKDGEE